VIVYVHIQGPQMQNFKHSSGCATEALCNRNFTTKIMDNEDQEQMENFETPTQLNSISILS